MYVLSARALHFYAPSHSSTPQMVLTDRLMAGLYPSLGVALTKIMAVEGPRGELDIATNDGDCLRRACRVTLSLGFYTGWWPALAQKIPSYGYIDPSCGLINEFIVPGRLVNL